MVKVDEPLLQNTRRDSDSLREEMPPSIMWRSFEPEKGQKTKSVRGSRFAEFPSVSRSPFLASTSIVQSGLFGDWAAVPLLH
jgi:hypothetical protein